MPYSHHSHSGQFCAHGSGTLEEVVLEAIKQGFEVFGLSEHVPRYRTKDLYPEEKALDLSLDDLSSRFNAYLQEAHRLKARYSGDIALLIGLETEYVSETDLNGLDALLKQEQGRVEYIVGSVHHVGEVPIDFDEPTYYRALELFAGANTIDEACLSATPEDLKRRQMEAFLCAYFDAQYTLMKRFHPEVIAHIDLCRLYRPSLCLNAYPHAWEKLERNIQYGAAYGALFECNAAALRKGWDGSYPGKDVVKLIQNHNGRFTLSDDSHGPRGVGLNYTRMRDYMRRVGIDEVWVLESSPTELNAGGRQCKARMVEGKWWEKSFWETKSTSESLAGKELD